MMTPKEKARELVDKFNFELDVKTDLASIELAFDDGIKKHQKEMQKAAKQCALICVDESHRAELKVIESISIYLSAEKYTRAIIMSQKNKQEVKKEINQL